MRNLSKALLCLALVSMVARADIYQRRYKYYLDANRAEEVLAEVVLHPRLLDSQWLNIVGDRKDMSYSVRRGDTLWGISARELGNPRLWSKLWEENAFLTNPHELTIGQILRYYREGENDAEASGRPYMVPYVKLIPGGLGKAIDLDNDNVFSRQVKNQSRPAVVVVGDDELLGVVTGAYTERNGLDLYDEVYVQFWRPDQVKIGDEYSVVRFERNIADTSQSSRPVIGTLMRVVATAKVTAFGDNLARVELTNVAAVTRRGDALIALRPFVQWSAVFDPPPEMQARVIAGDDADRHIFFQGDLLLLNKGSKDGVKEGFLFRIYRDHDLSTGKVGDTAPSYKGEVQVISTGEKASVGYLLRNTDKVEVGDTLVPAQAFLNPPPPPTRETTTIELK